MNALHGYFMQAEKYGIEYLKQNPNILSSEVGIIEEVVIFVKK